MPLSLVYGGVGVLSCLSLEVTPLICRRLAWLCPVALGASLAEPPPPLLLCLPSIPGTCDCHPLAGGGGEVE